MALVRKILWVSLNAIHYNKHKKKLCDKYEIYLKLLLNFISSYSNHIFK